MPAVTPTGMLTGVAFLDRNLNGVFNPGVDLRLAGATIRLQGTTKTGATINTAVVTNALGVYTFYDLQPGKNYTLSSGPGVVARPNTFGARIGTAVTTTNGTDYWVDGLQSFTRNLAFGGLTAGTFSLRQFIASAATGTFQLHVAGAGVSAASGRSNSAPTTAGTTTDRTGTVATGGNSSFIDLAGVFTDADLSNNSQMRIHTIVDGTVRDIDIELFDKDAARTVANFYNYVLANKYDYSVFHRETKVGVLTPDGSASGIEVLQGGGFKFPVTTTTALADAGYGTLTSIQTDGDVKNEFSSAHLNSRGTLSMARSSALDSASSQFFFNMLSNPGLDATSSPYTVFAQVIGGSLGVNQQTLDALFQQLSITNLNSTDSQRAAADKVPTALSGISGEVPTSGYTDVTKLPTGKNLAAITDIEVLKVGERLTYEIVSNSNAKLFKSVKIVNNRLVFDTDTNSSASGTASIVVRATDRFGKSTLNVLNVSVTHPKTAAVLNTSPSVPADGTSVKAPPASGSLYAVLTSTDAKATYSYAWSVNGSTVTGATASSYAIGSLKAGDVVKVTVTPMYNGIADTSAAATASTTINSAPTATVSVTPAAPAPGAVLTGTVQATDANGDTVTKTYQWFVNNVAIAGATGTTYTLASDVAAATPVRFEVTVTDGKGAGVVYSASVAVNTAPTVTVALSSTTPTPGTVLTATPTTHDANSDTVSVAYQWYVGGVLQSGATAATFTVPTGTAAGTEVKVEATPYDGKSYGAVTSALATVANVAPTVSVSLDNTTPTPGTVLTATATPADGNNDPVSLSYQWSVGGVVQAGATSNTFEVPAGTAAQTEVKVVVTPNDGTVDGTTGSATAIVAAII
ncbi:MAG: peptidylprolyl isomerase [Gemmataceae bacterium]